MSSFLVADSLVVNTQSGQRIIELCLGDITQLDLKHKADVLCVSVFGDYSPVSHTLVGALHTKLNLSIKALAQDKEEDLRHAYMCWWSKPLSPEMPFRKLLCFENRGRMCRPQEQVSNVFRCLVPILNNEPGTVITPLLNTGGQGCDERAMLAGMVEAAIKWMKAGLPLKKLMIVLYANVVKGKVIRMRTRDPEILKAFSRIKDCNNKEQLIPIAVPIEYDIYLTYSPKDNDIAFKVEAQLQASKPNIKIYNSSNEDIQEDTDRSYWQENIFKIMSRCARVVPILSPGFLESKACIDMYNMALCCNRRAQRDLLAPIYIECIKDMPTYMGLVQYIDCSPRDESKLNEGCKHLIQSLEQANMKVHMEMVIADTSPLHYDVFVSYSHKDSRFAVPVVEKLQMLNPELKIFFDIQEIQAGTAWQKMLYHALDGCRSFMCLVSNSYMQSAMCIEEFNLALAKHCSPESNLCLIPLCIETLHDPLPEFQQVQLIDATPDVFDHALEVICTSLIAWIRGGKWHPQLDTFFTRMMRKIIDVTDNSIQCRRLKFILKYGDGENILKRNTAQFPPSLESIYCPDPPSARRAGSEPCDVTFSCAPEDKKYVQFISKILREVSPGLVIKDTADTESERLALMESARKVVVLLSASYLESMDQVEEFHTVLLRQRYHSATQALFVIGLHNLPQLPTYFHLVPCEFHLFDPLWMELYTNYFRMKDIQRLYKMHAFRGIERFESIGIVCAICSLLEELKSDREHPPPPKSGQQPMLLNVVLLHAKLSQLYNQIKGTSDDSNTNRDKDHKDITGGDRSAENVPHLLRIVEPSSNKFIPSEEHADTADNEYPSSTTDGRPESHEHADEIISPGSQPPSQTTISPGSQPPSQTTISPGSQPPSQTTISPESQPPSQTTISPESQPPSQTTISPESQPPSQTTISPESQPPLQTTISPISQPPLQTTISPESQPPSQTTISPESQPPLQTTISPESQPPSQTTISPESQPPSQTTISPESQPPLQTTISPESQPPLQTTISPESQPPLQTTISPESQPPSQTTISPESQPPSQKSLPKCLVL